MSYIANTVKIRPCINYFSALALLASACGDSGSDPVGVELSEVDPSGSDLSDVSGSAVEPGSDVSAGPTSLGVEGESPSQEAQTPAPGIGAPGPPMQSAGTVSVLPIVGVIDIQLKPPVEDATSPRAGFASVFGRVHNGETPSPVLWTKTGEADGCELLVPSSPFCEQSCPSSAACTGENACTPYPQSMDAGEITVAGVETTEGASAVAVSPLPPSNTYQLIGATLAYPPFLEGEEVVFTNDGGNVGVLTASTSAIAPLTTTQDSVVIAQDSPALITWSAPQSGSSRVHVSVDISHHGGQKGEIRCDVPDNGSLEIPASLVNGLIALGFAGFPTVQVERRSESIAATALGGVAFRVSADVTLPIEIPGLNSCAEPGSSEECPPGETCQLDLKCAP